MSTIAELEAMMRKKREDEARAEAARAAIALVMKEHGITYEKAKRQSDATTREINVLGQTIQVRKKQVKKFEIELLSHA